MPVVEYVENTEKVRTTVRVPKPLYREAEQFVHGADTAASTINDFFIAAICAYVGFMKRKRIDAAFAQMAEDSDYQTQARLIADEFTQSDWETLASVEEQAAVAR